MGIGSAILGCLGGMMMTPSTWKHFRSFYYPTTHLPPIDLEKELPKYRCPDAQVVETAQKLASDPEVHRILSEPLAYEREEMLGKNQLLQERNFSVLGEKTFLQPTLQTLPCYTVSEHPELPGWVVKAGGKRIPEDLWVLGQPNDCREMSQVSRHEGLLRLNMNERMRRIACELEIDVRFPKEYAVPYSDAPAEDIFHRYFVLSEKLDLKSIDETAAHIAGMKEDEQIELARKISLFIKKVGFVDASFSNIRFTTEGQLAIVDTEPMGLYEVVGDLRKGHSVEKCARIGLFVLKTAAKEKGLHLFSEEVDRHYVKALQECSVKRVALSVICPLVPLVFLVIAIVNNIRIWWHATRLSIRAIEFQQAQQERFSFEPPRIEETRAFQKKMKPLLDRYYAAVEGIPFPPFIPRPQQPVFPDPQLQEAFS